MRRLALLVTLLLVAFVASPAYAIDWNHWSDAKAGTKARFELQYGTDKTSTHIQFERSQASAGRHQVTVRWRTVDGSLNPTSGWSHRLWTAIDRGERQTRRAPVVPCYPTMLQVQLLVRVYASGHWGKPRVLDEHTGSRISYC